MILDSEKSAAYSGKLLTKVHEGNLHEDELQRVDCSYENFSEKFKHRSRDFTRQYAHIYAVRLVKMRELLTDRIKRKWGSDIPVVKLIDLKEEDKDKCVIIGTLFKHQELKPSILREISEEHQLVPQPSRTNFVDEADQLILEDEQQRITLIGKLDMHSVVTGVICAVLGRDSGNGKFVVDDYCWACAPEPVHRPIPTENRFLILLSGLGLANNAQSLLPLQLLVDWISGFLGDIGDQKRQTQAVRLIIAGNSVRDCAEHKAPTLSNTFKLGTEDSLKATRMFDDFLVQLVSCIEVDVMPGEFDPSNHMLPQQPLHCCMFPQASVYKSMNGVSNPYDCEVGGRRLLGSSGQPVQDIARYSKLTDPLEILQQTLEWAHLAPTCPDTLSGYPYYQEDPFIISDCPDIYFAGNQAEFQTKIYEGPEGQRVRLVCIPSFAKTHSCAVVDLNTLNCYPMSFSANDASGSDSEQ